jgi:hypothetical protein
MTAPVLLEQRAPAGRRLGFAVAVLVNAAMLYAVNVWPGWQAVGFLSDDTREVLHLVNASVVATALANVAYLAHYSRELRALGDAVTTTIGLTALLRIWDVFPFDLADHWETVARAVLAVGIAGSVIAIVVALVRLGTARHRTA